jgi:hypothetical protein
MQKYVLAALLATCTLGAKIPLHRKPLEKTSFEYLKQRLDQN